VADGPPRIPRRPSRFLERFHRPLEAARSSVAPVDDILRIVGACTAELEATAVAKGWRGLTSLDFERAMWNASGARSATLQLKSGVVSVDVLLPDRTAIVLRWNATTGQVAPLGIALSESIVERAFVVCAAPLEAWAAADGWPGEDSRDAGAVPVMLDGHPFRLRVAEVEPPGQRRMERLPVELLAYDDEGDTVRLFFAAEATDIAEVVVSESGDAVAISLFERALDGRVPSDRSGCLEVEVRLGGRRLIDGSDGAALRERDPSSDEEHLARALGRGCPRWVP
jgi:hypothetical protein